jgi:multisubunit Na+/H+ antiporter MnhC subunit
VGDEAVMLTAIIISLALWGMLAVIAYAIYLAVA